MTWRSMRAVFGGLGALVLYFGCHGQAGQLGSETNWTRCAVSSDCRAGERCIEKRCVHAFDGGVPRSDAGAGGTPSATGGASSTTGGASSTTGGISSTSAGADADADTGAKCNDLPEPRYSAAVRIVGGRMPNYSGGGTIHDGTYELGSATVYTSDSDGGVSIEGRAHALRITGREWTSVSYFDNAPTVRYTDLATLDHGSVTLSRVCGSADAGILFGTQGQYSTAESSTDKGRLILTFPAGPAFPGGTAVLFFLRNDSRSIDACLGNPCKNSYDCCYTDGGGIPFDLACGAGGTCEACITNGLGDPCLGNPPGPNTTPDCCPGLRCVDNRCTR